MSKRARIAVIGAGGIGAAAHLPAIEALHDEVELVAIVDPDEGRRTAAGERFGCEALYADATTMLAEVSPDIAVVATPPHLHEPLAIEAMRAGAWVYCEKPLTGSLASADRIAAAEAETGRWCVTVSQFRYSGGSRQVERGLRDGRWGRPLLGISHTNWFRGPEYWDAPWRGKFATEFGGSTTTQAYHAVDLLLWLMGGDWASVGGVAETISRPIEVEDASVASVRFASGAIASVVSTVLSHDPVTRLEVVAEKASVRLETLYLPLLAEWTVRTIGEGDAAVVVDDWAEDEPEMLVNAHRAQLAELVAAWRADVRPQLTTEESRATLEFLTALYKSSAEGRVIARGEIGPGDPFYEALDAAGPTRAEARRG
ncbi:Gfo/Idh/MocA family protein [Homoserinibacter sp. GY 40078]|uniref:Gfo/Idh/MocA family protein n=1 Tax=Homoserinibacter sp. GY 40078 TaxID=2603275 RepID=UPI0011CC0F33|nr:Gfo/Idh/MocA family oxidoreductase [Homoserinibacter sp. GY 40078]TXK18631.1 Gfo/Idh/MocA family oxidoreductase [Homoserinibacter sp. GY 40078]